MLRLDIDKENFIIKSLNVYDVKSKIKNEIFEFIISTQILII